MTNDQNKFEDQERTRNEYASPVVDKEVVLQAMFVPVFIERNGGTARFDLSRSAAAPAVSSYDRIKRLMDVTLVVLSAPLWLPLCVLVGFAVWLEDRASPLFFQARIGKDGKPFRMIKFRTMVPNAGEILRKKLNKDDGFRKDWHARFKLKKDPRVTCIGRALRRLSIDELPQVLNVLRGEMSLVGPRPLPRYHHARLSQSTRAYREKALPGLTGLWQVSARDHLDNKGMELWDPYYVRNRSLRLDMRVLARTLNVVLRGKGAF